jgi:hypothetical protein
MSAIYNAEDNEDILGISVLYNSGVTCSTVIDDSGVATSIDYSFTFDVMCDKSITNMALIESQDLSSCDKKVTLVHNAGCPIYSALGFVNFMYENIWLSGSLLIIFGLVIGLFGKKWFGTITGLFGALFGFVSIMVLASIFHWLDTTHGLVIWLVLAILMSWLVYYLLKKFDGISVTFLCLGCGFFLGSMIEGLIIAITGWESLPFFIIVTLMCMFSAGIVGAYRKYTVQKYGTACVGSYLQMRGWSYFFGGYPSEMAMYNAMA